MEPVRRFRRADELTSGRALAGWLSIDGEPKGVDEMKIPGRNGSWRRPQARRRGRLQVRLQVRLQSASSPPPVHFRPGRARLHLYLRGAPGFEGAWSSAQNQPKPEKNGLQKRCCGGACGRRLAAALSRVALSQLA
jgi:hypothetical protein